MQAGEFKDFYNKFKQVSIDDKIDLYCSTTNLTEEQYMELLRTFPPSQISKLEKALG